MSTNFTGEPLSHDEITKFALALRRSQGIGDLEVPDLANALVRPSILTRFGPKEQTSTIVPDEAIGGDEAHTLISKSVIRFRISRTTHHLLADLDRRSRFTIAHELGHGVLHRNESPLARAHDTKTKRVVRAFVSVEKQADFFASMYLVTDVMAETASSPDELARRFLISDRAADIRWEREYNRRNRHKIGPQIRALAEELRNAGREPTTLGTGQLCSRCGEQTLIALGGSYQCTGRCNNHIVEFPDGDSPWNFF